MTGRVVGLVAAVAALASGCSSSAVSGQADITLPNEPSTVAVEFTLTGTAPGADITYTVGASGTEQQQGVGLPMRSKAGLPGLSFKAQPGDFLFFSAQNDGDIGSLTCSIKVNGRPIVVHRSSGAYSIVTCSGQA